ncbi:MAG: hypothetical protein AAGD35_20035 [Actinomycetota bacterium]
MNIVVLLIVVAVVLVVIGVLVFTFGHRLRGSLDVELANQSYEPGVDVVGRLNVGARRELGPGPLVASLICIEKREERDADGDRTTRSREVFRNDVMVEPDLTMASGDRHTVDFSLPTPAPQVPGAGGGEAPGWMKAAASLAGAFADRRTYTWYVEGRYDIKGLDLKRRRKIPFVYDL